MRSLFRLVDLSIREWLSAVSSFIECPYLKSYFLFVHPSTKGGAIMQLLTHIIFVLNLLKTLINHFT